MKRIGGTRDSDKGWAKSFFLLSKRQLILYSRIPKCTLSYVATLEEFSFVGFLTVCCIE